MQKNTKLERSLPWVWPGMLTPTCTICGVAISLAAIEAVRFAVVLLKTVGCLTPFHNTTAPDTNPVPDTLSVKPGFPATWDEGAMKLIVDACVGGTPRLGL